ncbi:MAG TPA: Hsp20/alpha crystallin family protein [Polyangiaceae bacterium]|jgi:HSP20 family molecular chaperone IbpA|nr:Hsp20/alpha crystallin family protein [Polyangiaceae bacterium]
MVNEGIQKAEKAGEPTAPEQTRPGPVYSPSVDIFENDSAITVLADMPGVKAGDLEIDLRESVLTLTGRVTAPNSANESDVLREYQWGTFFRQFTLSEAIDQAKIDAKLRDGVLRLELPKVEKARPRQITVRTD